MSWKKIAALSALLIFLLLVISLLEKRESKIQESQDFLYSLPAEELLGIELKREGETLVFLKEDGSWRLEKPVQSGVDTGALDNLVSSFSALRYDRLVESESTDFSVYGLDQPRLELKLFSGDLEKPQKTLLIGLKNEIDGSSYARLQDDRRVVMLPAFRVNHLDREVFDFREKKFLDLAASEVESFSLDWQGSSFTFQRQNGSWWLKTPVQALARGQKIDDILRRVAGLEAKAFLEKRSENEFGLEKPVLQAIFTTGSGSRVELRLGSLDGEYYAGIPAGNEVFRIGEELPALFSTTAEDYREYKVAVFYPFNVQQIIFSGETEKISLSKTDETWISDDLEAMTEVDQGKVRDILYDLQDLEAVSFIDRPVLPESAFNRRITLRLKPESPDQEERKIELLFASSQAGELVVRNLDLKYDFLVKPEILAKIPGQAADLLPEKEPPSEEFQEAGE